MACFRLLHDDDDDDEQQQVEGLHFTYLFYH